MPELPEVQTTVDGISAVAKKWSIVDVWTNYNSPFHADKQNIKNPVYFEYFKKEVTSSTIVGVSRRAKNILIHLSNKKTILIHMKMTGHIMCGSYVFDKKDTKDPWKPQLTDPQHPLNDPFNKFIHLVLNIRKKETRGVSKVGKVGKEKHLVLSDMRKFAKVTLLDSQTLMESDELRHLGPEPLEDTFTYSVFVDQLNKRSTSPIKQVLMDQTIIAGIGNIYSDEILWKSCIHPQSQFAQIPQKQIREMFRATKTILLQGIDFGGDSMSDYRNIDGLPGKFQGQHKAYRNTKKPCLKKGCGGTIAKIAVGGRSAHFCPKHQIKY